jgi:hypothetical protein
MTVKTIWGETKLKNYSKREIGTLCRDLSTDVYGLLWIAVENLSIKALRTFFVDKWWISHPSYPQVIHSPLVLLSACKYPVAKKSLTDYLHIHRAYYNC